MVCGKEYKQKSLLKELFETKSPKVDYIQLCRRIVHQRETESVQTRERVPKSVTFKTIAKLKGKLILLRKKEISLWTFSIPKECVPSYRYRDLLSVFWAYPLQS